MVEKQVFNKQPVEVTAPVAQGGTAVRTFASGATRNLDTNKLDYEGFLSPVVLEAFARYMNSHRRQADGNLRDSDNWQKGMGKDVFMKSLWRHFMDLWQLHRGHTPVSPETGKPVDVETAIAACLFNLQGYLHEHLQPEKYGDRGIPVPKELVASILAVANKDSQNAPTSKAPANEAFVTCSDCGSVYNPKLYDKCPNSIHSVKEGFIVCSNCHHHIDTYHRWCPYCGVPCTQRKPESPVCASPNDSDCPACVPH